MNADTKRRGPRTPYADRIRWTQAERELIIAAWLNLIRGDPDRRLSARAAFAEAMRTALPPERHRDPKTFIARDYAWLEAGAAAMLGTDPEAEADPEAQAEVRPPAGAEGEVIYWDAKEKAAVIAAGAKLFAADTSGRLTPKRALDQAQECLPPDRRRELRGMASAGPAWFRAGIDRALAQARTRALGASSTSSSAPAPPRAPAQAPAPAPIPPSTSRVDAIRWTEEERYLVIEAGIAILRADTSGRISLKQALIRAQYKALPPERHRHLRTTPLHQQVWFREAVEHALAHPQAPRPAPAQAQELAQAEAPAPPAPPAPPAQAPAVLTAPGTGFAPITIPQAEATAPAPAPILEAPTLAPAPVTTAAPVAELDAASLIVLGLARLVAERERIARREAEVAAAVAQMAAQFEAFRDRVVDRLTPLEELTDTTSRLLRSVLGTLDPALLQEFERAHTQLEPGTGPAADHPPGPPPGPGTDPSSGPLSLAGPGPGGGVVGTAQIRVPQAQAPPLPRICIVGLRPAAEAQVRAQIRVRAAVSAILDDSHALRHDYRQYDAVVITRHASHASHNRILGQLPRERVVRVRQTGVASVAAAIGELTAQHSRAWAETREL